MLKKVLISLFIVGSIAFSKVPQRAVSTAQFTTEILLSIGAEKQMAGTAYLDNEILPTLKEKFDKVPVLSDKYPTKEKFYSVNPDFVTGWESLANPKNLGTKEELEANGVQVYFPKSLKAETLDALYEDIQEYGKIFNLEKNANAFVKKMKEDLKNIQEKLPKDKRKKVLAYDSGDKAPFVIGGKGVESLIIEMAGGDNVCKDIEKGFGTTTWEKVLVSDPEYIIIVDYGDVSYDAKIKFLKEDSPIKDLKAVKENKFIKVDLAAVSPGVRIVDAIKHIATELYGIKF